MFFIYLYSITNIVHKARRVLLLLSVQKAKSFFRPQLRQAVVVDHVAVLVVGRKLQQPFCHCSSPEPIVRLIGPEYFRIERVILLERKRQVFLNLDHVVPIDAIPSYKLDEAMKRVLKRFQVSLQGSEEDISKGINGH